MQALMEQSFVQILVLVANIHPRVMNAEVEQSSMSTSVEHGLPGPKTNCNYFFNDSVNVLYQKGVWLIFPTYFLWC